MEPQTNSSTWNAITFSPETLITSLSPNIEGIAGFPIQEMIGHPLTQFLADRTVFQMPLILNTVQDEGLWEGEIVFRNFSGNNVKSYGMILPLCGLEESISGYLLQSKLNESQDLDRDTSPVYTEVGSRVRKLVHDLNNPLAVIMGSTQLLALNSGCTGKVRTDIEKLYSELERMAHVVERLHQYAISLCERTSDSFPESDPIKHSA